MLFNSYEYLIYFLPAAALGFFAFGERPRWAVRWLVVASLFFYGWQATSGSRTGSNARRIDTVGS